MGIKVDEIAFNKSVVNS